MFQQVKTNYTSSIIDDIVDDGGIVDSPTDVISAEGVLKITDTLSNRIDNVIAAETIFHGILQSQIDAQAVQIAALLQMITDLTTPPITT